MFELPNSPKSQTQFRKVLNIILKIVLNGYLEACSSRFVSCDGITRENGSGARILELPLQANINFPQMSLLNTKTDTFGARSNYITDTILLQKFEISTFEETKNSHFVWNLKIGWKLIIPTNGDWRHNFQLIFVISHFELKVFRIFKFLVRIDESEMDGRWRHNPDDDGTFLWCIPESRIDFQPRKSHLKLYKWNWFPTNYPVKLTQIKNFLSVGNDTTQTVIFIVIGHHH